MNYYFILIGVGANGKSVYTGLITNLHGFKNVSNVSLNSLVNNRFALADLENKDVNIDTELSANNQRYVYFKEINRQTAYKNRKKKSTCL